MASRCRSCRCLPRWSARACSWYDRLHSLSEGLATQIAEVERSIRDLAGDETFNIGSPMQLSHVLFDVIGLPTKGLKKTKRGYYSTNAKVLSDLARDHEIVRLILDWREV